MEQGKVKTHQAFIAVHISRTKCYFPAYSVRKSGKGKSPYRLFRAHLHWRRREPYNMKKGRLSAPGCDRTAAVCTNQWQAAAVHWWPHIWIFTCIDKIKQLILVVLGELHCKDSLPLSSALTLSLHHFCIFLQVYKSFEAWKFIKTPTYCIYIFKSRDPGE